MYERKIQPTLNCGLDMVGEVLYGKWKIRLLWFIDQGHQRPSELHRKIPDASRRVLNAQIKELEDHKLITKTIYPVVPPKVEYSLTDFGKSLIPVISQLGNCEMTGIRLFISQLGNWADEHESELREVIARSISADKP